MARDHMANLGCGFHEKRVLHSVPIGRYPRSMWTVYGFPLVLSELERLWCVHWHGMA